MNKNRISLIFLSLFLLVLCSSFAFAEDIKSISEEVIIKEDLGTLNETLNQSNTTEPIIDEPIYEEPIKVPLKDSEVTFYTPIQLNDIAPEDKFISDKVIAINSTKYKEDLVAVEIPIVEERDVESCFLKVFCWNEVRNVTVDIEEKLATLTFNDCSDGLNYNIYRADDFYTKSEDIIKNGEIYTTTTCVEGQLNFNVKTFSSYTAQEIADLKVGLFAYYAFDNQTLNDSTGKGNTLTAIGTGSTFDTGKLGEYSYKGNTSGYAQKQTMSGGATGAVDVSMCGWFKSSSLVPTSANPYYNLFSYGDFSVQRANAGVSLANNSGTQRIMFRSNYADVYDTTGFAPSLNTWYHTCVTFKASTKNALVYVNDTLLVNGTASASTFALTNWFTILATKDGVGKYNGTLDEVGIWNRTLTSSEVSMLYNNGTGLNPYTYVTDVNTIQFVSPTTNSSSLLNTTNNIQVNLSVNLTGYNYSEIYLYKDGVLNATYNTTNASQYVNFTNLADGNYSFNASSFNSTGRAKTTETRSNIIVDYIPLVISYNANTDASGTTKTVNNIFVNVTANDSNYKNTTINLYNSSGSLNQSNTTTVAGDYAVTFSNLTDGLYYFNATTCDLADQCYNTTTRNVTIDTTAPTIQYNANSDISTLRTGTSIFMNITSADTNYNKTTLYLYKDGVLNNTLVSTNLTNVINYTSLADANYTFNATACDLAGQCTNLASRYINLSNIAVNFNLSNLYNSSYIQTFNISILNTNLSTTNNYLTTNGTIATTLSVGYYYTITASANNYLSQSLSSYFPANTNIQFNTSQAIVRLQARELGTNNLVPATFDITPSYSCYQEFANESTFCGGVGTGTYSYSNALNDGNWATDINGDTAYYYVNYTKPLFSSSAIWQVKDGGATANLTISAGCWNANSDRLLLRTQQDESTDDTNWQCYNGTTWTDLRVYTTNNVAYEEAIYWYFNNTKVSNDLFYLDAVVNNNFNYTADANWGNVSLLFDGNTSSYTGANSGTLAEVTIQVNKTSTNNSLTTTYVTPYNTYNALALSSCYNYNSNYVLYKITSNNPSMGIQSNHLYCYDGSWQDLTLTYTNERVSEFSSVQTAKTYSVLTSSSGYFNKTDTISVSVGENDTQTIYNLSNSILNLTLYNFATASNVTNATVQVKYSNGEIINITGNGTIIQIPTAIGGQLNISSISMNNLADFSFLFTTNATYQNYTYNVYTTNSIIVYVYDETTGSLVTNNTAYIDLFSETNLYSYTTTTGYKGILNITPGVYSIGASATGYLKRTYSVTLSNSSVQFLNIYLTNSTTTVKFTILDASNNQPLIGATVNAETSLGNTTTNWTLIVAQDTDATGSVVFAYDPNAVYKMTFSETGYTTKSFLLNPIIESVYTVRLTGGNTISKGIYTGVSITPSSVYDQAIRNETIQRVDLSMTCFNNAVNNFSVLFSSPNGTFQYYGFSAYATNNVSRVVSTSGTNAIGGRLNASLNVSGLLITDTIYLNYYYYDTVNQVNYSTTTSCMVIDPNAPTWSMLAQRNNTFGLSLFDRLVIFMFFLVIGAGFAMMFGGGVGAGLIAIVITGIFIAIGFIPLYLVIIMLVTIFILLWGSNR